jgi:hypothetical protein
MKNQITERALACLNATNEAIVRSDYRDEALQGVQCCAQARWFHRRSSSVGAFSEFPKVNWLCGITYSILQLHT